MHDRLFSRQFCIGGKWINGDSGDYFNVSNPANSEIVGEVGNANLQVADWAIASAEKAQVFWKSKSGKQRSEILRNWYNRVMEALPDLAFILTKEQGKPLAEAEAEIRYAASFIEWFSEEAKRIYGDTMAHPSPTHRIITLKQPVGVVAAITPWNFPAAMVTRKLAPALAAGCTVVLKPSQHTPLTSLALAQLALEAGLNKGEINVVTSTHSGSIGEKLCTDKRIKKVSFTGSTEIGKRLMGMAAGTVKKLSLELGGNAPFLVFEDADLELAIQGAIASKYRNAGQTCVCTNRFIVHSSKARLFAQRLAEESKKLVLGNGLDQGVQLGPLINEEAVKKVEELVENAISLGAETVLPGKRVDSERLLYQPVVLLNGNSSMQLAREEIFGPVCVIYSFETEVEAIEMANDTPYGLAAYLYTRDLNRFWRISEALEYGIVGINEGIISNEIGPFGGIKESGFGREGSKYGLDEYLVIKYLCLGNINT